MIKRFYLTNRWDPNWYNTFVCMEGGLNPLQMYSRRQSEICNCFLFFFCFVLYFLMKLLNNNQKYFKRSVDIGLGVSGTMKCTREGL